MPDPDSLRIFTTSWSAPSWMKNTDSIKWGNYDSIKYKIFLETKLLMLPQVDIFSTIKYDWGIKFFYLWIY